jgi:hypothetical protein
MRREVRSSKAGPAASLHHATAILMLRTEEVRDEGSRYASHVTLPWSPP